MLANKVPHRISTLSQVWRWDQGRLEYFNFDNLRRISGVLLRLNGVLLDTPDFDPLREPLVQGTGLPFLPTHYKVWRNYARIFHWTLIAARINKRLVTTDICSRLSPSSPDAWDIDEYLSFLIPRLSYPSPATQNYNTHEPQVFPVCAVLKLLLARHYQRGQASLTIPDVFSLLVGNGCSGAEATDSYLHLTPTRYTPSHPDQTRQLRELLIFVSQSSFLKWNNSTLYLDVMPHDVETLRKLEDIATPIPGRRQTDPNSEVLRLGTVLPSQLITVASVAREAQSDLPFTEGKRVRVTHLRVERSPQLRNMYFAHLQPPFLCDMCGLDTTRRYPWTENLLEIHHLLPLTSVIKVNTQTTSFVDLVPLCPNCHRSVHSYYKLWLRDSHQEDFVDKHQARDTYIKAKAGIHLS